MKALTVKQPWANLLCEGVKTVEVRSWPTDYRGDLLICSSASPNNFFWNDEEDKVKRLLHAGAMIGVVEVLGCEPMTAHHEEAALCEVVRGAFAWTIKPKRWCRPDKVVGQVRFFEVADERITLLQESQVDEWIFDFPCPQGDIKWRKGLPLLG